MVTRVGSWMQTFTGRTFYPLAPRSEDIDPIDIAHALGLLCRYGGHVKRFYSVAEHCVLLSHVVKPENALHALLHDATEAYVGDMVRPLKQSMPNFQAIEYGVWIAIADFFEIDRQIPDEVMEADTRILLNEREVLMCTPPEPWSMEHMEPVTFPGNMCIKGMLPESSTGLYWNRLKELWSDSTNY
jgi:uncharacterized protein